MRYRITLRRAGVELRGYVDDDLDGGVDLRALADAVKPLGVLVIASPAAPDYDPFSEGP